MEFECNICNKKFSLQESLNQHNQAKHQASATFRTSTSAGSIKKKSVKKYIMFSILLLAVIIVSYTFYVRSQRTGSYDEFAKCLTATGAVVYGNDFCQYTGKQLNWFGKSEQYLSYVKCAESEELCDNKGVKTTPTWEINGSMYEGVQSFEKLAEVSGCKI